MKLVYIVKVNGVVRQRRICNNIINGFAYISDFANKFESMLNNRKIKYTNLKVEEYFDSIYCRFINENGNLVEHNMKLFEE